MELLALLSRAASGSSQFRVARSCELVWLVPWACASTRLVTGNPSPERLPLVSQPQRAPTLTHLVLKGSIEGSLLGVRNLGKPQAQCE